MAKAESTKSKPTKPILAYFNAIINNNISLKMKYPGEMLKPKGCQDKRYKTDISHP